MTTLSLDLCVALTRLGDDLLLGRVLLFPEVTRLGPEHERDALVGKLAEQAKRILEQESLQRVDRRVLASTPTLERVVIAWEADERRPRWGTPIQLSVEAACWEHGETWLAWLPAFDVEVFASSRAELLERIASHARQRVARVSGTVEAKRGTTADATDRLLAALETFGRERELELHFVSVEAELKSPRQVARQAETPNLPPVLGEAGDDLTRSAQPAYELGSSLARVAKVLTGRRPRSVLLVGPSGVGKTALVHELARQRVALELGFSRVWSTSGARLVAGASGFGAWQERCERLRREVARQGVLLHLGNLVELMEVGQSILNAQGVAAYFRPHLVRGDLIAIAECTPEQRVLVEQREPHLLEAFVQVDLRQPGPDALRTILARRAQDLGEAVPVEPAALDAIDRLHRRYATYSASPGRPLAFLERALRERQRARREGEREALTAARVQVAFAASTGLPTFLVDDAETLDLKATATWFGERVRGQAEATRRVVDLLATLKAALNRPRRPLASLLFIGPTGVGKTECAKALAEFLFGDRRRLTRFDMSEYQTPEAVARLVGGGPGGEGLLTARVREHPFAVLLLDEIEKAHSGVFDLLLQVLGEARLTDGRGRVADFSNAVVVMTSNLGAERFGRGAIGFEADGRAGGGLEVREHFTDAVREFLRPELFNRIDRIVPFLALAPETVSAIARQQLEQLQARPGVRFRDLHLEVGEDAVAHLAEAGHVPRFGARPLLRTLNEQLTVPLAEALNRYTDTLPLHARADALEGRLRVDVRPREQLKQGARQRETSLSETQRCADLRRRLQLLERSPVVLDLRNTLHRLERREARWARKRRGPYPSELAELGPLRETAAALDDLAARTVELEETLCLGLMRDELSLTPAEVAERLAQARSDWRALLIRLYCRRYDDTDAVVLVVYGENPDWRERLARAYVQVAQAAGASCELTPLVYGVPKPPAPGSSASNKGSAAASGSLDASSAGTSGRSAKAKAPKAGSAKRSDSAPATSDASASAGSAQPSASPKKGSSGKVPKPQPCVHPLEDHDPVPHALDYLDTHPENVVGIALSLRGTLVRPLLAPEDGLHVRRVNEERQRCLVHVWVPEGERPLVGYQAPEGAHRRGGFAGVAKRRVYDDVKRLVEDTSLVVTQAWPDNDPAPVITDLANRELDRALDALVIDDPVRPHATASRS